MLGTTSRDPDPAGAGIGRPRRTPTGSGPRSPAGDRRRSGHDEKWAATEALGRSMVDPDVLGCGVPFSTTSPGPSSSVIANLARERLCRMTDFYGPFSSISFTILGLWFVVAQTRYADWMASSEHRRRGVGGVHPLRHARAHEPPVALRSRQPNPVAGDVRARRRPGSRRPRRHEPRPGAAPERACRTARSTGCRSASTPLSPAWPSSPPPSRHPCGWRRSCCHCSCSSACAWPGCSCSSRSTTGRTARSPADRLDLRRDRSTPA